MIEIKYFTTISWDESNIALDMVSAGIPILFRYCGPKTVGVDLYTSEVDKARAWINQCDDWVKEAFAELHKGEDYD